MSQIHAGMAVVAVPSGITTPASEVINLYIYIYIYTYIYISLSYGYKPLSTVEGAIAVGAS